MAIPTQIGNKQLLDAESRRWWWWWRSGAGTTIQVNPTSVTYRVSLFETLAITDFLEVVSGIRISLAESLTIADLLAMAGGPIRLSETLTPQDSLDYTLRLRADLTEALSITDDLTATLQGSGLVLSEALILSDRLDAALRSMISLSETLDPQATFLAQFPSARQYAEMVQPIATLVASLRMAEAFANDASPTDSLVATLRMRADFAESLDIQDTLTADVSRLFPEVLAISDSIALSFTIPKHFTEGVGVTANLSHSLIAPRTYHYHFHENLGLSESVSTGGTFSVNLTEDVRPAERPAVYVHPAAHTTNLVIADALGQAGPVRLADFPGTPVMAFVITQPPGPVVLNSQGQYVAYAEGGWGSVGSIAEGSNVAAFPGGDIGVGQLRFDFGRRNCILNSRQGGGDGNLAGAWTTTTDGILLVNGVGNALWIGNAPSGAPLGANPYLQTVSEGGGYLRWQALSDYHRNGYDVFARNLAQGGPLFFLWYSGSVPDALHFARRGLSDTVYLSGTTTFSNALSETLSITDLITVTDEDDIPTFREGAAPTDAIQVTGTFGVALAENLAIDAAITHVHLTSHHTHFVVLNDALTIVDSLTAGGRFSAALSETLGIADRPPTAHVIPPVLHGVSLSDTIPITDALRAVVYESRPLNTQYINRKTLN